MRFTSDNKDEMNRLTISDRDIERLLSGFDPSNEDLAPLVPVLASLAASGRQVPSALATERFATEAALIVRSGAGRDDTSRVPTARWSWAGVTPRLLGAVSAVLIFFTMTGVAVAANGAAPGGSLYGLDRALERVGIGDGGIEERLEEAGQLVADGHAREALAHVDQAFDQAESAGEDVTSLAEARHAVEDAAQRLLDAEASFTEPVVKDEVEALLRFIRDNVHEDVGVDGKEFGQGVAELARRIGEGDTPERNGDEPVTTPTPADNPENSDNPGNGNSAGDNTGNGNNTGSGNGNGNGNGNGSGNGPPEGSPSEGAPGQDKKP